MSNLIDLHTHSIASDGSYTPSEIIELAIEKKLSVVALTDHDTVSGLDEFLSYADKFTEITAIPGVEISVQMDNSEVHIVGLLIDHKNEELGNFLSVIRDNRNNRNVQIIEKLQEMEYDITLQEVLDLAGGESVGRPILAKILIDKGYFTETQDVFDCCLKRGAPAYCSRVLPDPSEAIGKIHKAGGIAIWAHPVYRRKNERSYVRKTLNNLIRHGLDGIETHYTVYTPKQNKMLNEIATELGLIKSGGSDFHGKNQPRIELGFGWGELKVPEEIYLEMLSAKQSS